MLSHRRITTQTATVIGPAAVGVAARASAATADSSSVADNFLTETSGQGIDLSPQDTVSDAHIASVVDPAQADRPGYASKPPPNGTRLATQSI
jgi:hypothetical protein